MSEDLSITTSDNDELDNIVVGQEIGTACIKGMLSEDEPIEVHLVATNGGSTITASGGFTYDGETHLLEIQGLHGMQNEMYVYMPLESETTPFVTLEWINLHW